MKTLRTILFTSLSLGALAGSVSANAFNINEHDPRVTGRGGATAASNTEASSVIFNPGGIAVNEGTQVAVSGSIYVAEGSYEDAAGKVTTDSAPSIVPSIYATSRVHEMVAIGIGFHLPFGLAVSWPDPPEHRQAEVIQDQTLRTYFITPAVGVNLDRQVPGLSIGAGIDIVPATIELEQAIVFGETTGTAHLGGDALGIGARLGVMYRAPSVPGLKLGVMYRSPVTLDFEGKGDFDIAPELRPQLPPDGDITASIKLPQQVWAGVAYAPIPALELELNTVWINWAQTWPDDSLTVELPGDRTSSAPQQYDNTFTWRLGGEYKLPQYQAALRAGFVYDPTPISNRTMTATLPDANRINISLGGSKQFGSYGVHAGLLWVTPQDRETSDEPFMPAFKGTYAVQAIVASIGVSGTFGMPDASAR